MAFPALAKIEKIKPWLRAYWLEIAILAGGLVAMNLIFIAAAFRQSNTVVAATAGQLGDFVGGYVGTFFARASVVLITHTFRNQLKTTQLLNFEAKYFELIRLHRENVKELKLKSVVGRRLFVMLLREFRSALEIVRSIAQTSKIELTQHQLANIAYYCLFYGAGHNASRMLRASLAAFDHEFVEALIAQFENHSVKLNVKTSQKLAYLPFDGHQSRLGHYYRHLYQAVQYVDDQELDINKYDYVKTIRAQLSNHEQALLLLNSLTPIGSNWWKKGFITRYRIVKNLPRDFFDARQELDVGPLFPPGYFEWENA